MDKSTLSNYGWIVIAVLVLAVMIALATPFGSYIKTGVENTTQGLFDTSEKAMNVVGMSANAPKGVIVYSSKDGGKYTKGYFLNNGVPTQNSSYCYTEKIPVEKGVKYTMSTGWSRLVTYDTDGNYLRTYNGSAPDYHPSYSSQNYFKFQDHEVAYMIIPDDVAYLVFDYEPQWVLENGIVLCKGEYVGKTHDYTSNITGINNLTGKSVVWYGDSYISGARTNYESFPLYIKNANNMTAINKGKDGKGSEYILSDITEYGSTYDYIIVEGFINDVGIWKPPIGELTPVGTSVFDTTTFIGRIEKAIYDYKQSGCTAKLGFILTNYVPSLSTQNVDKYWDAAISVFEKYDVDYFDFRPHNYPVLSDRLHLNFEGVLKATKDIELWMNGL